MIYTQVRPFLAGEENGADPVRVVATGTHWNFKKNDVGWVTGSDVEDLIGRGMFIPIVEQDHLLARVDPAPAGDVDLYAFTNGHRPRRLTLSGDLDVAPGEPVEEFSELVDEVEGVIPEEPPLAVTGEWVVEDEDEAAGLGEPERFASTVDPGSDPAAVDSPPAATDPAAKRRPGRPRKAV
jgi:hypothetical protein